ncbi:hypothetical protein L2822_11860, partial [Lactobacillus crispatus]
KRKRRTTMTVKLRKVGNSKTLTVPKDIIITSKEYTVKNEGMNIVFTPVVKKKKNIFATKEWQNYDYQKDIENDVELQSVKPVGREVVD